MSLRGAATQFGYLLGASLGGASIASAGYPGLAVVLSVLFLGAAAFHVRPLPSTGEKRNGVPVDDLVVGRVDAVAGAGQHQQLRPGHERRHLRSGVLQGAEAPASPWITRAEASKPCSSSCFSAAALAASSSAVNAAGRKGMIGAAATGQAHDLPAAEGVADHGRRADVQVVQ